MDSGSRAAERKEAERKKREAELQHGKNLLVAYLSDVGGYDRKYRDVEDEDENGSKGMVEVFVSLLLIITPVKASSVL